MIFNVLSGHENHVISSDEKMKKIISVVKKIRGEEDEEDHIRGEEDPW